VSSAPDDPSVPLSIRHVKHWASIFILRLRCQGMHEKNEVRHYVGNQKWINLERTNFTTEARSARRSALKAKVESRGNHGFARIFTDQKEGRGKRRNATADFAEERG
jgi:sarcosine oxidase delta subunit